MEHDSTPAAYKLEKAESMMHLICRARVKESMAIQIMLNDSFYHPLEADEGCCGKFNSASSGGLSILVCNVARTEYILYVCFSEFKISTKCRKGK